MTAATALVPPPWPGGDTLAYRRRVWNYLQVEATGRMLYPTVGPGGMTREQAHGRVRAFLALHAETATYATALVQSWDEGAQDDTVYAGTFLWAIYESDDAMAGARDWVDDLARNLRRSGSKVKVAW